MATEMAPAPPQRRGIHVPAWILVALGALVVFGLGFGIGRASDRHEVVRRFGPAGAPAGGGRGVGLVLVLVVVALVGVGIYLLVHHFSTGTDEATRPSATGAAEAILADRLARGEIDDTEYRARRDALLR